MKFLNNSIVVNEEPALAIDNARIKSNGYISAAATNEDANVGPITFNNDFFATTAFSWHT